MDLAALNAVAEAMVTPGKGILAADESTGTIKKRFDAIGGNEGKEVFSFDRIRLRDDEAVVRGEDLDAAPEPLLEGRLERASERLL